MTYPLKLRLIRYGFVLAGGLVAGYITDSLANLIKALR